MTKQKSERTPHKNAQAGRDLLDRLAELRQAETIAFAAYVEAREEYFRALTTLYVEYSGDALAEMRAERDSLSQATP